MARPPSKMAPPAWRRAAADLVQGLTEASTLAALCMAASFALALGATAWFFSPATLAGPWGAYLARSPYDADSFVTQEALALAATPASAPRLLVVGPSTLAQALGHPDEVEEALATETDVPWEVHMLATPLQSPYDQMAILETVLDARAPTDPPMLVVLGVGPQRMTWLPERLAREETHARLGLRSSWADEEMRRSGHRPRLRTGLWAIDNHRVIILNGVPTLVRLLLERPAVRKVDIYSDGAPTPVEARDRAVPVLQFREGVAAADGFVELHRRLAERLAAYPGVRLALVEETLDPDFIVAEGLEAEASEAEARIEALAREVGAPYWRIVTEAGLTSADFYDDLHVFRGAPQDRIRAALARHVAAVPVSAP